MPSPPDARVPAAPPVPAAHEVIEELIATWRSIHELALSLGPEDWKLPTDLPGWSVQDLVSHMSSIEAMLLSRAEPEHEAPPAQHVRNPLGEWNEQRVDRRRSWTSRAVLEEFDSVTGERAGVLRTLSDEELGEIIASPLGVMPVGDFVRVRLLDSWLHEQDIRRAVGVPETLETAAAARVLDMVLEWLPRAVAKAGVAEGEACVVHIADPLPRTAAAVVRAGRGVTEHVPANPCVRVRSAPGVFIRTATGRLSPAAAIAAGGLHVSGERDLAERILVMLNRVP
jgi:uncharacterized protein (TIGR03083 family)